jgi:hypothetical protein
MNRDAGTDRQRLPDDGLDSLDSKGAVISSHEPGRKQGCHARGLTRCLGPLGTRSPQREEVTELKPRRDSIGQSVPTAPPRERH